jgi:hypothetical protein
VQGGCVSVDGEHIGSACGPDEACGSGLTCGEGFPGGYCLTVCSAQQGCPEGSVCALDLGRCLRACGPDCTRSGYACGTVPNRAGPLSACVPVTSGPGDTDGGTDAGTDPGCSTDFQCTADRRCFDGHCELGPRIGGTCQDSFECPAFAQCNKARERCEESCNPNLSSCEAGYRCAPDGVCVENCTGVPETLGLSCENSLDCTRCGVCLSTGGSLRCRQRCSLDRDCPGGAAGACEQVGATRACKL